MIEPAPMPPPPAPTTPPYAGFGIRALAFFMDGLVLVAIESPFFVPNVWLPLWHRIREGMQTGVLLPGQTFYGWTLLGVAIAYLYAFVMIGRWNATLGKFAVKIRVRKADGTPAGWREAALRPLLQTAIALIRFSGVGVVGLIDYLWMVWDKQSQTLHDKIAGTIVVNA